MLQFKDVQEMEEFFERRRAARENGRSVSESVQRTARREEFVETRTDPASQMSASEAEKAIDQMLDELAENFDWSVVTDYARLPRY